jgi:hypothetical protein
MKELKPNPTPVEIQDDCAELTEKCRCAQCEWTARLFERAFRAGKLLRASWEVVPEAEC